MEKLHYIFRNNGFGEYNDDVFDYPSFDIINTEYSFLLKPSLNTYSWRFGIVFSKTDKFEFYPISGRYNNKSLRFIEIDVGERFEKEWRLPNRLELGCYYLTEYKSPLKRHENYIPLSPLELIIKYDFEQRLLFVSYNSNDINYYQSISLNDYRYFKIFAWADETQFELECTISTKPFPGLALSLIEENIQTKAKSLDLSNCGMKEIPQLLTQLTWLEELILASDSYYDFEKKEAIVTKNKGQVNEFSKLPKELGKLTKLKKLVISGHYLNILNLKDLSGIENLLSLTSLNIDLTFIQNFDLISNLENLQFLSLAYSKVRNVSFLSGLKDLVYLDLTDSQIVDCSEINSLSKIKILWLANTKVNNLAFLFNLGELEELYVSYTSINSIISISRLDKLKRLDLSHTQIDDITPLSKLKNLEYLDFSKTNVNDISPLSELKDIQSLFFDECKVKLLYPLRLLTLLKDLRCNRNPIEDCPADVYESNDPKQIRTFFNAKVTERLINIKNIYSISTTKRVESKKKKRTNKTDIRKDVKLIILGNSNGGKTNLVEFLKTGKFSGKRNTTHGLEVLRWLPEKKRFPSIQNIAVNIWDFGGQEYYHGAYRLFLSDNALYLLLWCSDTNINGPIKVSLRENEPEVDLENFELRYWLDTIRHYSGVSEIDSKTTPPTNNPMKSRLLAMQNKVDNPDIDKKRIAQELHEKYQIADSFHVSLKEGSNEKNERQYKTLHFFLSELENALRNSADKESVPSSWQKIRNTILSLKGPKKKSNPFFKDIKQNLWISISDFQKACNSFLSEPLTSDEIYTIPRWLEKGGTVVYFPDILALKDKIFLNPDDLAKNIYKILQDKVRIAGGEFSAEMVFDEKNNEIKKIFLELTQHLELIFPHPTKEKYFLAPQYLPDVHPIEDLFKIASYGAWQSDLWIKVPLFYYKKILHGILLHYASDPTTECRYFWKHGIMFMKNGLRVLIKGLYPEKEQHEGVILIGVEKEVQKQRILQNEIFNKFRDIMLAKDKTVYSSNSKIQLSNAPDIKALDIDTDIQVSYDGKNYITYKHLLENLAEPKIKATNNNSLLITYNFAAILPKLPQKAKKVFLSYSHQNTKWLGRLRTHLAGLRRAKQIETWDDKEILPGDLWDSSIKKSIEEADVFILLLSADFIASDYIWNEELPKAIEKFKNRNAIVIPILFEPLDLGGLSLISEPNEKESYKISDFEIIPKTLQGQLQAVSLWGNQEEALADIAKKIREAIHRTN